MLQRLKKFGGYTMMEIIIVTVVVATLSSLALMRYNRTVNRFQAEEAKQTILSLWGAQKKYQLRNGSFTGNISNLDIELRNSQNFNYSISTSTSALASAISQGADTYTLSVDVDGVISCAASGNVCERLGY